MQASHYWDSLYMLFRNFTPFPPQVFESRDEKLNDFGVVVLRGTFHIENGRRLRLAQEQEPLVMADEYLGAPGASSLRFESNLAPYKPRADVLVTGSSYSPTGDPQERWVAAVQFGDVRKELQITGSRQWHPGLAGWSLSPIEPTLAVSLTYENAFGGSYVENGETVSYDANPAGCGYVPGSTSQAVPVPQMLPVDCESPTFGKVNTVGFGPVPPGWTPRRDRAGTFNVIWQKTRWPDLPEDFSFDFYQTASEGLTLPGFATGAEHVRLENLAANGTVEFQMPCFELATLLRFKDGRMLPAPVNLDTVHFDTDRQLAFLTWRGVYPIESTLRVLEVRMRAPDDVIDQSSLQTASQESA